MSGYVGQERRRTENMSLDGDVGELRGVMQGLQKNMTDFTQWLLRFEQEHKADIAAVRGDIGRIETKLNEHAIRNKVIMSFAGFIGAVLLSLSTFFSGAWSYMIGKH